MKSGDKRVVILIMSLAIALVFLGFASASEIPLISNPTITPENPTCSDNLEICATVVSTIPLMSVEIECTAGTTNILKQFMTRTTGDEYCKEFSTTTLESKDRLNVKCEISASNFVGESKINIETIYSCPPEPTCEYNVGINYQYSHSDNTGINIGHETGSNWIDNTPVNLTSNNVYDIKLSMKNYGELIVNNLNILFKIDNNILNNSYKNLTTSLLQYQKITLNTSQISCGYHNISAAIYKENCNNINLTDNYASRQIYVNCTGVIPPTPDCNDNNACTTDSYNGTICLHTPIVCNDNNASTTDSCNVISGCVYIPIINPPDCNDNNACTTDIYNGAICVHNPIICNDNNASTTDSCNVISGCVYTPIINPPIPYCGDGICNATNGETCSSCVADCGICNPPITHVCGDGVCNSTETCSTCSIDCGSCGNNNNNDNCDSSGDCCDNKIVQFCNMDWKCTGWSQCSNGIMIRKCVDNNHCDVEYGKPIEKSSCTEDLLSKAHVKDTSANNFWLIAGGIIILIILLIILVNML